MKLARHSGEEVQQHGHDGGVDEVDDQGTNQWDDEEGGRGWAEALDHDGHVGDGVRRGAEAEATGARCHDGGLVVAAHDAEDQELGEEREEEHLAQQHDHHRDGEVGELPELETHEGTREEDGQAEVAEDFALALVDLVGVRVVGDVADDGGYEHGADVVREDEAGADEDLTDDGAEAHGNEQVREGVHEAVVVDALPRALLFVDGLALAVGGLLELLELVARVGWVETLFFGDAREAVAAHEEFAHRAAEQAAGDEAEGGSGKGNRRRVVEADAFKDRAEGTGGAVTADHRDGACREAHERVQVKDVCQGDADGVLAQDQEGGEHGHLGDEGAALADQADAGRVADAREEEHHEDVLHDGILAVRPDAVDVEDVVEDGEEDAADDRGRDAVAAQEGNLEAQEHADVVDCRGGSECLVDVEIDVHDGDFLC